MKNSPTFALYEKQIASILEAIEEISNKGLSQLSSRYLLFAIPYIKSENNNCRREASRIVGNMAAQYPDMIEEAICEHLNISDGETTEDGLFTLNNVACLGCCSLAPVMMVKSVDGDETYGNLTKDSVKAVLDEIRARA